MFFVKVLLGVKLVAILLKFVISANRAIVCVDCLNLEFYVFAKFLESLSDFGKF